MRRNIKYLMSALTLFGIFVAIPLAHAEYSTGTTSTANTTSSDTTSSESQDKPTDKRPSKERIEELKRTLATKLSELEQGRIKAKCSAAQGALGTLHTRINQSVVTRTNAYQKLTNRLNKLVEKLKVAGVDTAELEAQINLLSTKIEKYKTDLADYRQALTDLKSIDCTADPVAFKAALESARAKREVLSKTVQDVRTYVSGTIKPTLVKIHTELKAQKESDDTTN